MSPHIITQKAKNMGLIKVCKSYLVNCYCWMTFLKLTTVSTFNKEKQISESFELWFTHVAF